jgi:dGTPase
MTAETGGHRALGHDPDRGLAPYAVHEATSPGRRITEPPPTHRGEFQRDRDRIIHASSFRRLVYKTQVFVNHEGDLYRTRLTHSLEVAQIARTVAGALGLNEYLVEAVCLAHDLGHTPFGHAGQDALNRCMADYGGFEHNFQSLRVVDELEDKYARFAGLNLMYDTREGILKHCTAERAAALGELGRRFLTGGQPGLEAQLANLADSVAYTSHDVDDGLRAGLLDIDGLRGVEFFDRIHADVTARYEGLAGRRLIYEIVREMIGRFVIDLIDESRRRIAEAAPADVAAVRSGGRRLIAFGAEVARGHRDMKRYLLDSLYRHERVLAMTRRADRIVTELFGVYLDAPACLPAEVATVAAAKEAAAGRAGRARVVADYIAGMTDRFAIRQHRELTGADAG